MSDLATNPSRKPITAQNIDEAKAAAYANDPQTELVILGLSENPGVTTCGFIEGGQQHRTGILRVTNLSAFENKEDNHRGNEG